MDRFYYSRGEYINMGKILIVEDDKEINLLLRDFLKNQGYNIAAVDNGLAALSVLRDESDISLVLLDIKLPFQSGDMVLKKLREFSDIPVIVVSAKDMVQTKIEVLRMGADDYITKPFDLDELLVRVETVLRRTEQKVLPASKGFFVYKNIRLEVESKSVWVNKNYVSLTAKEYQILFLLLKNQSKLFSKANLYESVWDELYCNEDNTLKVHISNLRNKIKKYDDKEEYIETIWGMGYRLKI